MGLPLDSATQFGRHRCAQSKIGDGGEIRGFDARAAWALQRHC
jgi:hypothetical protein